MSDDCILCYEPVLIYAIGKCNHNPICFLCTIKNRNILKNKSCPICKEELRDIVLSKALKSFNDFDWQALTKYSMEGIFFNEGTIKEELDKINKLQCVVSNCPDSQVFNTIVFLKKHLKDKHQRYLCDICYENKTAILKEQKIYSANSLQKHLTNGDHDDDGNLIFFHPYCTFCAKSFYNEDIFMKHLKEAHIACDLCGPDLKFVYYQGYKNLEIHYKFSHYLCQDPNCLAAGFMAFKTLAEYELHTVKVHSGVDTKLSKQQQKMMNTFTLQTITGFVYDDNKPKGKEEKVQFNDKEGLDFEEQFLSQKRTKLKALSEKDTQIDYVLDIRDFYQSSQLDDTDEEDHKEDEGSNYYNRRGKKNKGYAKKLYVTKEEVFLENVKLIKYRSLWNLWITIRSSKAFEDRISRVLDQDKFNAFWTWRKEYTSGKITAEDFFARFSEIFGKKASFKHFPFFIATIQNEETQKELDDVLLQELRKLPRRTETLLTKSLKYSDFVATLLAETESSLVSRIKARKLIVSKKLMEKSRVFQLIEILRRVKTVEMPKFKFLTNFGVSLKSIEVLTKKVPFMAIEELGKRFEQFPNEELLPLYLYLSCCAEILSGKKIHKEKNQLSGNILKDLVKKNESELKEFLPKANDDEDDSSEEDIQTKKPIHPKKKHVEMSKAKPVVVQEEIKSEENKGFDPQCKFEFPVFVAPQPQIEPSSKFVQSKAAANNKPPANKPKPNASQQRKIDTTNAWENQNRNPFVYYSTESKVSQKALAEEFPSLVVPKNEKKGPGEGGGADFYANNEFPEEEEEKMEVIGKKGKGKNKKVVYSGGFY